MEPKELLILHIRKLAPLTRDEGHQVAQSFREVVLPKKGFLLKEGQISEHMRFIARGCFRNYTIDENGREHILQFGIEEWWINDLYSYLTHSPATYSIQALEASTVLQIRKDSLEILYREVPSMERFFRLKIQGGYVALQERTMARMSLSAEERYLDFRRRYRNLEQRLPQYMIASYLDITPEFLSALRKKLIKSPRS